MECSNKYYLSNKREQIINAAVSLIAENGYSNVGTKQITEYCGLKPATLYYYFPKGKSLLLATAIEKQTHYCEINIFQSVKTVALSQRPKRLINAIEEHYQDNERIDFIVSMLFNANDLNSEIKTALENYLVAWAKTIRSVIDDSWLPHTEDAVYLSIIQIHAVNLLTQIMKVIISKNYLRTQLLQLWGYNR